MDNQLEWQKVRSERGPDLGILNVRFDWLKHPTEDRTLKRLVLESVDWINVVALTEDGRSVMVEQYRFGTGSCTLETPGGMVDAGETPLQAAQRELKEETGYSGGRWVAGCCTTQSGDSFAFVSPLSCGGCDQERLAGSWSRRSDRGASIHDRSGPIGDCRWIVAPCLGHLGAFPCV